MKGDNKYNINDVVGYVYAGPGNDTTYLIVKNVRENGNLDLYDLVFEMDTDDFNPKHLWLATEDRLNSRVTFFTDKRQGSYSIKELANEYLNTINKEK